MNAHHLPDSLLDLAEEFGLPLVEFVVGEEHLRQEFAVRGAEQVVVGDVVPEGVEVAVPVGVARGVLVAVLVAGTVAVTVALTVPVLQGTFV